MKPEFAEPGLGDAVSIGAAKGAAGSGLLDASARLCCLAAELVWFGVLYCKHPNNTTVF